MGIKALRRLPPRRLHPRMQIAAHDQFTYSRTSYASRGPISDWTRWLKLATVRVNFSRIAARTRAHFARVGHERMRERLCRFCTRIFFARGYSPVKFCRPKFAPAKWKGNIKRRRRWLCKLSSWPGDSTDKRENARVGNEEIVAR